MSDSSDDNPFKIEKKSGKKAAPNVASVRLTSSVHQPSVHQPAVHQHAVHQHQHAVHQHVVHQHQPAVHQPAVNQRAKKTIIETLGIDNIIGEGSFKALYKPKKTEVGFTLVLNKNESSDDFLIGTFNPDNFIAQDVYQEFLLYNEFGHNGISPKINYVIANGKQYSLRTFLSSIDVGAKIVQNIRRHIPENTQFIIEKYDCDDSIMQFFQKRDKTIDYAEFFRKLRAFIENIVVNHHY